MAEVPPDDPGIKKAAIVVRTQAKNLTNTYAIACCILFLDRINKGFEDSTIRMLGNKLLIGQDRQTGGWEYHCPIRSRGNIDHSCSQFALLGLWISRRYGLKADIGLRNAEARFRILQQPDGGWFYRAGSDDKPGPTTLAMTCAGMMALAFGMSTRIKSEAAFEGGKAGTNAGSDAKPSAPPPDPNKDPNVQKAREYLKQ